MYSAPCTFDLQGPGDLQSGESPWGVPPPILEGSTLVIDLDFGSLSQANGPSCFFFIVFPSVVFVNWGGEFVVKQMKIEVKFMLFEIHNFNL